MQPIRTLQHILVPLCLVLMPLSGRLSCQTTVGIQPFGTYQGSIDQINLADLSVHVDIPLFVHKARGANMGDSVHLIYDTSYYSMGPTGPDSGWRVAASSASGGTVTATYQTVACTPSNGNYQLWSYQFVDSTGYVHGFAGTSTFTGCTMAKLFPTTTLTEKAADGSGYLLIGTGPDATVTDPHGSTYYYNAGNNFMITDANGNVAYPNANVDTSGIAFTLTGGVYTTDSNGHYTGRTPMVITYKDPSGTQQSTTVTYGAYTYQGSTGYRVVSVKYPDLSLYQFGYQMNLNLGSITLPTGGEISYETTPQTFAAGSSYSLVRTTPDGQTTYTHTINSLFANGNYDLTSQTIISKPDTSSELVNFVTAYTNPALLRLETAHSWLSPTQATLKSTMRCYNGSTGTCTNTAISLPITQISMMTTLDTHASSKTVTFFNASMLPTELDEYDYGATTPSRKTMTTYNPNLGNILDRPMSVAVEDAGNPIKIYSQTTYGYDEYGLPNLSLQTATVNPSPVTLQTVSGPRGNMTSEHSWILATNTSLDTHWQYDTAGQIVAMEDPAVELDLLH